MANFDNALSVGDIDNHENDDWRLKVLAGTPLRAFAFVLRDNHGTSGERLELYDRQGALLDSVSLGDLARDAFVDDGGSGYETIVSWGANEAVELTGDFVDTDGDGGDPRVLEGIKIIEPLDGIGLGSVVGGYTYDSTGGRAVSVCLSDVQNKGGCLQRDIDVQALAHLDVDVSSNQTEIADGEAEVTIRTTNLVPEGGGGLPVHEVELTHSLSEGLDVLGLAAPVTGCAVCQGAVRCTVGSMTSGTSHSVALRVRRKGTVIYDAEENIYATVTTSTPAIEDEYTGALVLRVLAPRVDSESIRLIVHLTLLA